jgi:hypothetical protein
VDGIYFGIVLDLKYHVGYPENSAILMQLVAPIKTVDSITMVIAVDSVEV